MELNRPRCFVVVLLIALAFVKHSCYASTVPPRLTGTFIQLSNADLEKNSRERWIEHLNKLKDIGIKTVFVQYVSIDQTDFTKDPRDPIPTIIEFCENHHMPFYIGTWASNKFIDEFGKDPPPYVPGGVAQRMTIAAANSAASKYNLSNCKFFSGWYFSLEPYFTPLSKSRQEQLNSFFKSCLQAFPVKRQNSAISVFLPDWLGTESYVADLAGALKGSGVNILLIQDSVGKLKLKNGTEISTTLKPYLSKIALLKSLVPSLKIWLDLEIYERTMDNTLAPAKWSRILDQLNFETPYFGIDSEVIAWDCYNFMTPLPNAQPEIAGRLKLYDSYRQYVSSLAKRRSP